MDGKFIKNVLKIAISNIFIILSGVVSGFFLPKLLGVTDYGFYKIFNLYITYGVFFDLGISNGIYLLYGGYKRAELPKETFRFYFSFFLKIQIIFAIIVTMVAIIFMDNEYKFIFVMVAAYTLVNNIATYFEKISVMIGEFNASAQRNILKSVLTIFIIFVLWVGIKFNVSVRYFQFYTVLFVIVYGILAFQYCLYYKELIFGEKDIISKQKENLKKIVKVLELAGDFEGFKDYILNNDLINIVVPKGSLLNYTITEGKEKEALWLIENGIDINAFDGLELMTAIKKNNNIIAKKLIDEGIVINSREMKDNPLVSAIRFSNAFLVEELMKNYRNLIVTYSNEYVRNCSVLDIAERTKNEKIINIVKKYLV